MKNESRHKLRLQYYTLALALVMETVGTIFLFMDAIRLNTMVTILDYASFGGEPAKFHALYHHAAQLGFLLIFAGMILHVNSIWLEQALLRKSRHSMPTS
jgi:hypothetical protein